MLRFDRLEPRLLLATVQPTLETADVSGDADDAAIWVHPTDPSLSVVIGTDKASSQAIRVYDLAGRQISSANGGEMNNVDLRYNFPFNGSPTSLVAASDRSNNTIALFAIDPDTRSLVPVGEISTGISVYGLCMYQQATTGSTYAFVNAKSGAVQQWELSDDGQGNVQGQLVRSFDVGSQPEGCVADDELGYVYIGEESRGIWKYGANPEDGTTRTSVDSTGSGGHLTADVEGLTIYYANDGTGYLMASSQGSDEFVIYAREDNNSHIGTFQIVAGNGIDAVSDTDGIDVVNFPLDSMFSQGMFVAQDNGYVTPLDVLVVINYLNRHGSQSLPLPPIPPDLPPPYLDANGDDEVAPVDALLIINYLNSQANGEGEAAAEGFPPTSSAAWRDQPSTNCPILCNRVSTNIPQSDLQESSADLGEWNVRVNRCFANWPTGDDLLDAAQRKEARQRYSVDQLWHRDFDAEGVAIGDHLF